MANIQPLSLEKLTSLFRTSPKDDFRIVNREGTTIEFKETYSHANMAQYFKTIASFANNAGGYIIFGVGDKPRCLLGLRDKSLQQFEELKVEEFTKALLDYFAPEIQWDHCTFEYKNKSFGVLYVFKSNRKPCICKKPYDASNPKSSLKEGDIFYRYGGRSERIRYTELSSIIDEVRKQEEKQWLEFAQKAAQIGVSNAAILDLNSGHLSGKGGTIVLDNQLLQKISFIREGEFVEEKGKPTLRLVGDIQEITHGKVIVTGVTKKVVRAIEPNDIIESFLNDETTEEPLEYIKRICSATTANYPVYHFIKQSNLSISEILQIVDQTTSRGTAKGKLLERLNGKAIECIKIPVSNTAAATNKKQYREQWLGENLSTPINKLNYCIQAIYLLTPDEILAHKKYICATLLDIFHANYESASSIIASYLRIAICRIDEALNLGN
ncbi:MAG: ATP-binding protein [Christensenellaceae bacterium]